MGQWWIIISVCWLWKWSDIVFWTWHNENFIPSESVILSKHFDIWRCIKFECFVLTTSVQQCSSLVMLLSVTASAEHIPEVTTSNHIITETTCISAGMCLCYKYIDVSTELFCNFQDMTIYDVIVCNQSFTTVTKLKSLI